FGGIRIMPTDQKSWRWTGRWICTSYLSICGLGNVGTRLGRRRSSSNSPAGGAPFVQVGCTWGVGDGCGWRISYLSSAPLEPASERRVLRLDATKRRVSQHSENTDSGNEISSAAWGRRFLDLQKGRLEDIRISADVEWVGVSVV
ncbi:hypothetical protein LX32DRAFT_600862, partial [Colletotrichum zoysiae]